MIDLSRLNKFQQIACEAKPAFGVLANDQNTDFLLVALDDSPVDDSVSEAARLRGLGFTGAIGLVNGVPRIALAEPLEDEAVSRLVAVFLAYFERLVERVEHDGGAVLWCENLLRLPDTR
jgi:hypothetical protein